MLDDKQLIDKATELFSKVTASTNPSPMDSQLTEMNNINYVILRNNKYEVVAVYEVEENDNLHILSDIPSGIE